MTSFSHYTMLLCTALMLCSAACSKKEEDHTWDHYDTHAEPDQGYIDNDEYYVPPTGGYSPSDNSSILDPD